MFKLIAILYLVVQGQVSDTPSAVLKNHTTFATEEACMNYFDTPEGAKSKTALMDMVAAQDEAIKVEFKCVKENTNDDGSI